MTEWAARRFWTVVEAVREGEGWTVRLDLTTVRSPSGRPLLLPTKALAEALAAEWRAQGNVVDLAAMPVTRAANTAIDKVAAHRSEVVQSLAAYGETDLLCYRAERPHALASRQAQGWDPLLDWADEAMGARLIPVAGVMPHSQDEAALGRLAAEVEAMDAFVLTGFHDLVALSGSLVLALAVVRRRLGAAEAWELSRIDETHQAETWGRDEEAERAALIRRGAFFAADRFVSLSQSPC